MDIGEMVIETMIETTQKSVERLAKMPLTEYEIHNPDLFQDLKAIDDRIWQVITKRKEKRYSE